VRLILDAMRGDHTLFTTAEGIERLWEVSIPLLEAPPPVRLYSPGAWGPKLIHQLVAPRAWRRPFERAWRDPTRRAADPDDCLLLSKLANGPLPRPRSSGYRDPATGGSAVTVVRTLYSNPRIPMREAQYNTRKYRPNHSHMVALPLARIAD
jgi:Glucose-6-phosphate dehydrogenase, C-terminal domain